MFQTGGRDISHLRPSLYALKSLCVSSGKTVRHCLGAYFQLKDDVFCGKRPYNSEPLENFLKREFGETTRMSEREYPRVVVTGVLADRMPAELHLFRNYELPNADMEQAKLRHSNSNGSLQFESLPRYTGEYCRVLNANIAEYSVSSPSHT